MKPLLFFAGLLCAWPASAEAAEPPAKPNIIVIVGDDVGLGNVGCYGGPFPTPNLDALAAGGTRFEHCYASPLCGPSRAMLFTGRYGFRTGMISNTSAAADHKNEIMLPKLLRQAGYVSVLVGKWSKNWLEPNDWGFNEYLRTMSGGKYWGNDAPNYLQNGETKPLGERYFPDVMHEFLVDFMTRHRDRPFFAVYSLAQMHARIQRTPDSQSSEGKPLAEKSNAGRLYADNNAYMDKLVGQLVAAVDELGLRDKTLIVFTGDNGTSQDGAAAATVAGRMLSGKKGSMLEGGCRVPLIVNWRGTTPAGRVLSELTDLTDFFPTFAALAGAPLPPVKIDGRTFEPQLNGRPGVARDWVFMQLEAQRYVRSAK